MNLVSEALRHIAKTLPDSIQFRSRRHVIEDAAREIDKLERPLDEDVRRFHILFRHPAPVVPVLPKREVMNFRRALIMEECKELCDAMDARDLGAIAQESVDLIFVVLGTLVVCGLRLRPFWQAVNDANMKKIPNPAGGKPLKPDGWVKPKCGELIDGYVDDEPIAPSPLPGNITAFIKSHPGSFKTTGALFRACMDNGVSSLGWSEFCRTMDDLTETGRVSYSERDGYTATTKQGSQS